MFNTPRKLIGMTAIVIAAATGSVQAQTTERVEFTLATHNNNTPGGKQLDDGKSFGFSGEYKSHHWIIGGRMDGYTHNSDFNEEAGRTEGIRGDHDQIYALYRVGEARSDLGQAVVYAGFGYQWLGNLGGAHIQNAWHSNGPGILTKNRYNQRYTFNNTYEVDQYSKPISGSTPDIRAYIEANSKPLYENRAYKVSGYGIVGLQIPLNKYGERALNISTGVRAEFNSITMELGGTLHLDRRLPRSDVIQRADNNPRNYLSAKISGKLWKGVESFIQIQGTKQDNLQGTAGIKMTF